MIALPAADLTPGGDVTQTLLVVDDEPQFLRTLATNLRGAGYDVETATTVEGALSAAKGGSSTPSCSTSSCPTAAGRDVCAGVRGWSDVPIVVVSAVGEEREKVEALDAGADDYVVKPFALGELLARLRAVLRRVGAVDRARPAPRAARDRPRGSVGDGETAKLVHLTPHEFDLLRVLGENEGKLMTHARILREVWGPAYQREANYLHVYVSQLRRKIEDDPGPTAAAADGARARLPARRRNPKTALRARVPTVAAWKSSPRSGGCVRDASSSLRDDSLTPSCVATTLPSPRLAWRTNELCSDEHRRALAPSRWSTSSGHRSARYLPGASPLNRVAARDQLALLLQSAPSSPTRDRRVPPRGVLLVEQLLTESTSPLYRHRPASELAPHWWPRWRRSRNSGDDTRAGAAAADQAARRRPPEADRRARGDAAPEAARAADLRLGRALLGGIRDRGGARRSPRSRLSPAARSSCRSRSRSRPCSRSSIVSYQQTVRVYESSGGAYVVAKDNLGHAPEPRRRGCAAHRLRPHRRRLRRCRRRRARVGGAEPRRRTGVGLSLAFIALITIANLRGVRESGLAFAIPTYAFIASMLALVLVGRPAARTASAAQAVAPEPMTVGVGTIGLFVLLRAFASGSTALTGVEAIANGVSAFRRPQSRNAARTLGILGVLAITFFIGVSYLAIEMHAVPNEGGYPSVVSQIARVVFPDGSPTSFMYYAVQASTVAILVLAANTAYQGFPRLAALLAHDRFFPRQFTNLGDRLVFSNGIIVLAGDRRRPDLDLRTPTSKR